MKAADRRANADETAVDDSIERRELVVGDETDAGQKDDWERLSNLESSYPQAFDGEAEFPSANYSGRPLQRRARQKDGRHGERRSPRREPDRATA